MFDSPEYVSELVRQNFFAMVSNSSFAPGKANLNSLVVFFVESLDFLDGVQASVIIKNRRSSVLKFMSGK